MFEFEWGRETVKGFDGKRGIEDGAENFKKTVETMNSELENSENLS